MPRTYGKSKGKAKQARLSFVPPAFGSDDKDEEPSRNANLRYSHPSKSTVRRERSAAEGSLKSAPERSPSVRVEPEVEPVEKRKSRKKDKKSKKGSLQISSSKKASPSTPLSSPPSLKDSESESDIEVVHSVRKHNRVITRKKDEISEPEDAQAEEDSDLEITHSARKPTRNRNMKRERGTLETPETQDPEVEEESESDVETLPSARKSSRHMNMKREREDTPETEIPQAEDESDVEIMQSARKKTRALKRKREASESEDQQAVAESDADEVVSRPRRKLRRGGAPQPIVVDDDLDEEGEDRITPSKSPNLPHTPRRDSAQDRIDLDEDLEDLQDSVVKTSRTRGNVPNSARAKRQQHLEALRRRRAGQREESDEDNQLSPTVEDEQENSEDEDEDENREEEEAPVRQPQFRNWADESEGSDVESTIGANEDLDRYEDDFVDEDEDEQLGAPAGLEDIPIEFSRHAYKQMKDYFQDAVEWMVHNQLNPAFPRSDPVYKVAFDKLEAEVRGRTGSQLVSSVWNTNFRRSLLARPQIEVTAYPTDFNHPCDACNRSGHPASFDVKLHGKAYALDTLEPLADADSDDEQSSNEDESDEQDRDREGYTLPDEDTHFYLGRHCMKNASMAHTLTHWRVHLNEWVVEHLRIKGQFSDKKILKRSQYSQRKKNKSAAKAFNKMVEEEEVKKLWRDFHINLRNAREAAV
ncbi:hypothetical protein BJY04DRAFT_213173 [Aspergillus karnatakaensis]|uniref:uncharacterized protein n=1 Tax=Aspergillus karnatakaensis TaxID=1810916 RepID=UPI003CCC9810